MKTHARLQGVTPAEAGMLVRRLAELRRRDRAAAAVNGAVTLFIVTAPVLLGTALAHRYLLELPRPALLPAASLATIVLGGALAALRPRSLEGTAHHHDRRLGSDQLLPAAFDAATGRRPVADDTARLLVRQALTRLGGEGPPARSDGRSTPVLFAAAAWLGALMLLGSGPEERVAPLAAAPAAFAPPATAPRATDAGRGGAPGPASRPAVTTRGPPAARPTGKEGVATGMAGGGGRRGAGDARGGATAAAPGDLARQRAPRWTPLAMAAAGAVAAGAGPATAGAGMPAGGAAGQVPATASPPRLLRPSRRLLVAAFLDTAARGDD